MNDSNNYDRIIQDTTSPTILSLQCACPFLPFRGAVESNPLSVYTMTAHNVCESVVLDNLNLTLGTCLTRLHTSLAIRLDKGFFLWGSSLPTADNRYLSTKMDEHVFVRILQGRHIRFCSTLAQSSSSTTMP